MPDYHTFRNWPKVTFKGSTLKKTFKKPKKPKNGKGYDPCMMVFDGTTGYYQESAVGASGADLTMVIRFNQESFTGGGTKVLYRLNTSAVDNNQRLMLFFRASDYVTVEERSKLLIHMKDGAASVVVNIQSNVEAADGQTHVLFISRRGSDGAFNFILDGVEVEDGSYSSRVLSAGTPANGGPLTIASTLFASWSDGTGGKLGYFGYKDEYLTDWSAFMKKDEPKEIDEVTWTEWNGQPKHWNTEAEMTDNKGTLGNMTKSGVIVGPYCAGPTDVAGLIAWYDGSDHSTIWADNARTTPAVEGGNVSAWDDKSIGGHGISNTAAQVTPKYNSNQQNGLSAIKSNLIFGVAQYLRMEPAAAVFNQTQNVTIFYVGDMANAGVNNGILYSSSDRSVNTNTLYGSVDDRAVTASTPLGVTRQDGSGSANSFMPAQGGTVFNQGTHVIDNFVPSSRLNGVDGTASGTAAGTAVNDDFYLFSDTRAGSGAGAIGFNLAEFLIYDRVLSASEIDEVEAYLKAKWATP